MADATPLFSRAGKQVLLVLIAILLIGGGGATTIIVATQAVDERAAAKVEPLRSQLDDEHKRMEDQEERLRVVEKGQIEMQGDVKAIRVIVEQLAREPRDRAREGPRR